MASRAVYGTVFADLNKYEATTHFNGQSTVVLDGDRATGESYTIAHHVFTEAGVGTVCRAMPADAYQYGLFVRVSGEKNNGSAWGH